MPSYDSLDTKLHFPNSRLLHQGKRVNLVAFTEGNHTYEVLTHPGASVIIPFLDPTTILLIRNKRVAVRTTLLELPAGTRNGKEDPLLCAKRELEEETGYKSHSMAPLFHLFSTPGFCTEVLYIFVAKDLEYTKPSLDETEEIEVVPTKWERAIQLIHEKEIVDGKTIASLLYYHTFVREHT